MYLVGGRLIGKQRHKGQPPGEVFLQEHLPVPIMLLYWIIVKPALHTG